MGVTARYELSQRLAQVRAAMDAWADVVTTRVREQADAKVVTLATARARA
jgi:hypothetical protein